MHARQKAETWARRFARAIVTIARHQDRRGVLVLDDPRICRCSDSGFIELAGLATEPKIRFRAWVDPNDAPGIIATRELAPRPTMYDVSFSFHSDRRRLLERVARSARRYYRPAGREPALDARPPVLELDGEHPVVELGEIFGVPATGRAPNPLAVVDVAFFLLQVARLYAGLQPLAPTVERYTRSSLGTLVGVPDREHVVSRFLCPGCRKKLWSIEDDCESCGWDLHIRRARTDVSPYDYEYDGN